MRPPSYSTISPYLFRDTDSCFSLKGNRQLHYSNWPFALCLGFSLSLVNYQRQPQIWFTGSTTTIWLIFSINPNIHFVIIKIFLSEWVTWFQVKYSFHHDTNCKVMVFEKIIRFYIMDHVCHDLIWNVSIFNHGSIGCNSTVQTSAPWFHRRRLIYPI